MQTKRILLVDDDARLRHLLRMTLASTPYQLDQAASGAEALARVRACPPDLIILDLQLIPAHPNGLEVCRQIKGDPATASCRIVMLTATDDPYTRLAALAAGAEEYLTKPFNPPTLRNLVEQALQDDGPGASGE